MVPDHTGGAHPTTSGRIVSVPASGACSTMRVRDDVGGGGKLTMDWKPARRVRRRLVPSNSATFTLSSNDTK